jgi:hypothetical protein
MGLLKSALAVVLCVAAAGASFWSGRATAPKIRVFNSDTGKFVALQLQHDTDLYVLSPDSPGVPGVAVDQRHDKDGYKVLVWPYDLADLYKQMQNQQQQPIQPQAQHERLDHANNL